jgi:hypothetical protein
MDLPRALTRSTQNPFSPLWNVTRSTRPARISVGALIFGAWASLHDGDEAGETASRSADAMALNDAFQAPRVLSRAMHASCSFEGSDHLRDAQQARHGNLVPFMFASR